MKMQSLRPTTSRSSIRLLYAFVFAAVLAAGHSSGSRVAQALAQLPNPVVAENMLAGTTDNWEVFDPADPNARGVGDASIQGFATDISVNRGAAVSFKIKLGSPTASFVVDVYRLGYYGGMGPRQARSAPA